MRFKNIKNKALIVWIIRNKFNKEKLIKDMIKCNNNQERGQKKRKKKLAN